MESLRFIDSLYVEGLQHASVNENQLILSRLVISPNPCSDRISVSFNLRVNSALKVQVFDMQGRKVFGQNEATYSSGTSQMQVDVSGLPPWSLYDKDSNRQGGHHQKNNKTLKH